MYCCDIILLLLIYIMMVKYIKGHEKWQDQPCRGESSTCCTV